MAMECLIINIGSASKKYALYHNEVPVLSCHFELSTEGGLLTLGSEKEEKTETITLPEYDRAITVVMRKIEEAGHHIPQLCAVRVVAPGTYFQTHRLIDEEYLRLLAEAEPMAPLHITATRKELELLREILPNEMIVAASDSAFHADMPEVAANYALPETLRALGIRRFGYHGLSVASIKTKLNALPKGIPERVIVCHLGSGCSITALRDGSTVDTTMGFTPL
jgi:acetate kinase